MTDDKKTKQKNIQFGLTFVLKRMLLLLLLLLLSRFVVLVLRLFRVCVCVCLFFGVLFCCFCLGGFRLKCVSTYRFSVHHKHEFINHIISGIGTGLPITINFFIGVNYGYLSDPQIILI